MVFYMSSSRSRALRGAQMLRGGPRTWVFGAIFLAGGIAVAFCINVVIPATRLFAPETRVRTCVWHLNGFEAHDFSLF